MEIEGKDTHLPNGGDGVGHSVVDDQVSRLDLQHHSFEALVNGIPVASFASPHNQPRQRALTRDCLLLAWTGAVPRGRHDTHLEHALHRSHPVLPLLRVRLLHEPVVELLGLQFRVKL